MRYFFILLLTFTLYSCSKQKPDILVVCERNELDEFELKWETSPALNGDVSIYVSDNPEQFEIKKPIVLSKIKDGMAVYIPTDNKRPYFLLSFSNKYNIKVSDRAPKFKKCHNFRDLGGYVNNQEKRIKWGMLYRSGRLDRINKGDSIKISTLNIQTIIQLYRGQAQYNLPSCFQDITQYCIPIECYDLKLFLESKKELNRDSAIFYMIKENKEYVTKYNKEFASMFDYLLQEKNYPIILTSYLGKDNIGFASALILSALDISEDQILADYLLSNKYISPKVEARFVYEMEPEFQEAATALLYVNESYIKAAFNEIQSKYGSMDNYFTKALNLNQEKRDKLKEILLERL